MTWKKRAGNVQVNETREQLNRITPHYSCGCAFTFLYPYCNAYLLYTVELCAFLASSWFMSLVICSLALLFQRTSDLELLAFG